MEVSARAKRDDGSDDRLHSEESCFGSVYGSDTAETARFESVGTHGKIKVFCAIISKLLQYLLCDSDIDHSNAKQQTMQSEVSRSCLEEG